MNLNPETAGLALDTLLRKPTKGVPTWGVHIMSHSHIERLAGEPEGSYRAEPERVYTAMKRAVGCCVIDQFIPTNPLTMGDQGYEGAERKATTGAEEIVCDGIRITSPESVVEHLESVVFPSKRRDVAEFDEDARVKEIMESERALQEQLAPEILKTGYQFVRFPILPFRRYGYADYFMAYALYPEVIERDFALAADLCLLNNRAAARAYREGNLPPLFRLDFDMADSRGMLVDIRSLDRMWFPHFARCLQPVLDEGVRLIWHCDGNLMDMVPRLLDVGVQGFQGFQYEDGMDYEKICRMRTRDGEELIIVAGVSVTTTLPHGRPDDVRRQLRWLVDNGPKTGLFLACSSSVAPGVPWENITALVDGFKHYRENGRA